MLRHRPGLAVALGLAVIAVAGCTSAGPPGTRPQAPRATVPDSRTFTTGTFDGCPPEGSGGDHDLNRLKNRDKPPPSYVPLTIGQIVANAPPAMVEMGRARRYEWSPDALRQAGQWEDTPASVEGYILQAKQMEPETCNCESRTRRDYHLYVGADPDSDRSSCVIMEVSPRLLDLHPNWHLRILKRLSKDRARVRISGWLMWDQEHPEQVGRTRGTLWEVHPIHLIEVWSGGRWRSLDGG